MEIKILFEIEYGSKQIIENFSKALLQLGNTTTIQSAAGTVIGKVTNFVEKEEPEDVYVKNEAEIEKSAKKPKKTTKKAQTPKPEPKNVSTEELPQKQEREDQEMKNWQTNDVKTEPAEEEPMSDKETHTELPTAEPQGWSYEQLRAGCAEASRMNLGAKLAELIRGKYSIPKLDELDPKLYDAFIKDLREMGVRI